jgi:hypothetical protein
MKRSANLDYHTPTQDEPHSQGTLPLLTSRNAQPEAQKTTVPLSSLPRQTDTKRMPEELTTRHLSESRSPGGFPREAESKNFTTQKYEYIKEIARGGMGRVVLVRDRVTYRLPMELEWEVAAHGTDGRRYTWGEVFWPQAARLSQGYGALTNLQVSLASRNNLFADESVFGVWDMTGSQAEWCSDLFGGRDGERVLRGNAWALQPVGLETAFRTSGPKDYFHASTGFRLAIDAPHL